MIIVREDEAFLAVECPTCKAKIFPLRLLTAHIEYHRQHKLEGEKLRLQTKKIFARMRV